MSMVSNLSINEIGEMHCWCPACGEWVEVDESDFNQIMDNGDKEYSVYCPKCGQGFYAAESYYNPDWQKEDEQMSKNFDDAYRKWVESHNDGDVLYCKKAFIAGANWQKEQMREDAVDGEVVKIFPEGAASIHYQAPCGIGEMAYFCKAEALKDGDKVKIIIVKEDEK